MLKAHGLAMRAGFAALCGCAASGALAIDSLVPADWNITPLRAGAWTETFASAASLDVWTNGTSSAASLKSAYTDAAVPARTNDWFDSATTALTLDTDGLNVTNNLSEGSGYVNATADNPAYIDMLVRFDALEDTPEAELFADAKLALYVAEAGGDTTKLVCWANNAYYTNSVATDTGVWSRVTVKLAGGKFNVLLNDAVQTFVASDGSTTVTEFDVTSGAGTATQLERTIFRGTGDLADLYVSHCDPTYAVAGATTAANKNLASATQTELGVTNVTKVQSWMASHTSAVTAETADEKILAAYIVDDDGAIDSPVSLEITAMDIVSPALVKVTVALSVDGTPKTGSVNGVLRLMGATEEGGEFEQLNETAITDATFADGSAANLTFEIPEAVSGVYHIFKPVLSAK